ncbi:MAG: aldo/keto reductase [Clostridia bacterium]|nr:aldo/keto reductase [Clostridia bacterium]
MELGADIKNLGFGLMRLPMLENGEVDIDQMCKMVDRFLEKGFTYFDTAYGYLGGKSEKAAKVALFDRYPRESFQFATKMPIWEAATPADMERMLQESLERTGAGYFDFYLLHNIASCGNRLERSNEFDSWSWIKTVKERGLAKHIGFSFHDTAAVLDELLTKHPYMEFVQLQINYADWDNAVVQSRACYEVARKHGKSVVIMEPIKGGSLATPPPAVAEVFKEADASISPSAWALRFAASLDGLITVLSGMSTIEQMEENTEMMAEFTPITEDEKKVYEKAVAKLNEIGQIPCTACRYCVAECPNHFEIPEHIASFNNYKVYGNLAANKGHYKWVISNTGDPAQCLECGLCEAVCPQKLPIIESLKQIVETFG